MAEPRPQRLTVSVPEAGRMLGLGRDAAYAAAARGDIPTLTFGRRLVVPLPRLLELVGAAPDISDGPGATPGPTATLEPVEGAQPHGDTARLRSA